MFLEAQGCRLSHPRAQRPICDYGLGAEHVGIMAKRLIPLLDRVLIEKISAPTKSVGGVLLPDSAVSKVIGRSACVWSPPGMPRMGGIEGVHFEPGCPHLSSFDMWEGY
jgi:hypothetical protein